MTQEEMCWNGRLSMCPRCCVCSHRSERGGPARQHGRGTYLPTPAPTPGALKPPLTPCLACLTPCLACLTPCLACLTPRLACLTPRLACLTLRLACLMPCLSCLTPCLSCLTPCLACLTPRLACLTPRLACLTLRLACLMPCLSCLTPCLSCLTPCLACLTPRLARCSLIVRGRWAAAWRRALRGCRYAASRALQAAACPAQSESSARQRQPRLLKAQGNSVCGHQGVNAQQQTHVCVSTGEERTAAGACRHGHARMRPRMCPSWHPKSACACTCVLKMCMLLCLKNVHALVF